MEDRLGDKMRRNRAYLCVVLTSLLVVCMTLSGCDFSLKPTSIEEAKKAQAANISPKVSTPAIKEDGVLVVGLKSMANSAPMCETDKAGELFGIDVDVASAIADNLGLQVKFVQADGVQDPKTAAYDIVMDVKATEGEDLTVVGHYADTGYAFFQKADAATLSVSDLEGKTVGIQPGSNTETILSKTNIVMTQKGFANLNEAFEALDAGNVDFVLCEVNRGAYCASLYSGINMVGTIDVPEAIGVGVSTSNPALQKAVQGTLDDMSTNGVLSLIKSRWIGDVSELSVENQIEGVETKSETEESTEENNEETEPTAGSNAAVI